MVDNWYVKILDMFGNFLRQVFASNRCDNSPDAMFLIKDELLFNIRGLQAAYKLLTKMAPAPLFSGTIHWISYLKVPSEFIIC